MLNKSTPFTSGAQKWQRHVLAHACFMVAAGISTSAFAVDYTPGAVLKSTNAILGDGATVDVTQSTPSYWSTGYNQQLVNSQLGSGQIDGVMGTNSLFSILSGAGSTPVSINGNNLMLFSYGNQNSDAAMSLNTLSRVSSTNDGQLALNLQIFSGLAIDDAEADRFAKQSVLASATETSIYITQTGKSPAALSLSSNSMAASLALNTVSTTLTGATPTAYVSTTQGTSSVAYGDNNSTGSIAVSAPSSTRGTTGSVNLSNLQTTFNAEGTAQLDTPQIIATVQETLGSLSSSISVNANNLTVSNTSNEASNVVLATSGSASFTGSVSVTNIQATKTDSSLSTTQLANVKDSSILADVRHTNGESMVTGTVNVNGNTVSAKSLGNTAGTRTSSGAIAVGNAILFEGSADYTGTTAPSALNTSSAVHTAEIGTSNATGKADLLINSVQRNAGNAFTGTVDNGKISTQADNLAGGALSQNNNTQTATATANLAGNMISLGNTGSVGNISANAAVMNTQVNETLSAIASVVDSTQQVTVGIVESANTITGTVSLNNNSLLATAEGNVAASQLTLKSSNLTLGGNGTGMVTLTPTEAAIANAGLASTVLSVQANNALTLTANNNGNTIAARFNDQEVVAADLAITASQVSVNGNVIQSTAVGNAASNTHTLVASTATGLNAGLGNSQSNTDVAVTANAGYGTDVVVAISAGGVMGSQLSMNTNNLSATAKGNSATNNLSITATNASGLAAVTGGLFASDLPYSQAADAGGSTGVQANADLALANAQTDGGGVHKSVLSGSAKITTASVQNSTIAVNDNSLMATTSVNSASNTTALSITNMMGLSAGLSSSQSVAVGSVTADVTGEVSISTGSSEPRGGVHSGANLSLNTNTIQASVAANTVVNAMTMASTTATGRDLNIGEGGNLAATTIQNDLAKSTGDVALVNHQKISDSEFTATTLAGTTVMAGVINDPESTINGNSTAITVNGNSTLANVSANRASNSLGLTVNNLSKANTGLASLQNTSNSSFTAQLDDASTTLGTGYVGSHIRNGQVAVTNNIVKATVLGNVASNSVNLSGSQSTGSTTAMADSTTTADANGSAIITSASVGLANWQSSNSDTFSANLGGISSTPKIVLTSGDVGGTSTLSLNSNLQASSVYANDASNSLALSVTQMTGMTAALASGQAMTGTNISTSTLGQVTLTAENVSGSSATTANSNLISATLSVNNVNNTLQLRGDQFTGQNSLVPALTAEANHSSGATVVTGLADLSLANVQRISGNEGGAQASVQGDVLTTFNSLSNASASTNSNSVSVYASGNAANNISDVLVTGFNTASQGLGSVQYAYSSPITATALGQVIAQGNASGDMVSTATVAVNSNNVRSTAAINIVDNTLSLRASNATGAAVSLSNPAQTQATSASATADWAVVNTQLAATSSVLAQNGTVESNSQIKLQLSGNALEGEGAGASALSLNSNAVNAVAYGNSANNTATVVMSLSTGLQGAMANLQNVTDGSTVSAETRGAVEANIKDISNASLTVNSNAITALAKSNTASNTVAVTADNAIGRNQNPSTGLSSTNAVAADFSLINQQMTGNGSNPSAYNNSEVRTFTTDISSSTISQNGNAISSLASANQATNSMTLAITELQSATAGLLSSQLSTSSSAVSAETIGGVFSYGGNVWASGLSLNDNLIKSNASNNLAVNQISVTGSNAQSGSSSLGSPSLNLTGTSADVSVVNTQLASSMGSSATTNALVEQAAGSIEGGSTVNVNNNQVTSQAYLSSASNDLTLNVTHLTAMNANVLNSQNGTNGSQLSASTDAVVQISATGSISDSTLSLKGNAITATANRNAADNTLTVQASTASGRAVSSRESLASAALVIQADYALGNAQVASNSSLTSATTVADILMYADTNPATNSQLTVEANNLTAYASGNSANNQMTLAINQLSQASAAVSSFQSGASGAATLADTDARVLLTSGNLDTVALAMKDNTIKATAIGNMVANSLQASSNTFTGTGTGSVTAQATSSSATVSADLAISNVQSLTGGAAVIANSIGSIAVETGSGTVIDSTVSLTGNSVKSLAVANSASNDLVLTVAMQSGMAAGTSNGLTAAVSSSQTGDITVSATTTPQSVKLFGIQTDDLTGSSVTLSNNTTTAVASKNEAFNTLTIGGANVFGRGGAVTSSVAGTSSVTGADFAVINAQSASGATTANIDAGTSGLSTGAMDGGTVTLSGNSVLATASANTSGNAVNLTASNLLEASAVVNNVQSLAASASVTSSVQASSALSVETTSGAGTGHVTVSSNVVKSTASANVATNALNASSSNGTAGAGAVTSPSGSNTATPTFAVLNAQSTGAGSSVTSTVYGFNMGGSQLNGALNSGGSATVTGNTIQSLAYGNSSSNAIQVAALSPGLNTASASITNVQYNLASVTATVSGVNVQGSAVNSTGAANVNVGGNSIVAMAVGNRAVNSVAGR